MNLQERYRKWYEQERRREIERLAKETKTTYEVAEAAYEAFIDWDSDSVLL